MGGIKKKLARSGRLRGERTQGHMRDPDLWAELHMRFTATLVTVWRLDWGSEEGSRGTCSEAMAMDRENDQEDLTQGSASGNVEAERILRPI